MGLKQGAIFDMDGVLFDTEALYQQFWHEIAAERNITLNDAFAKTICGTSGQQLLDVVKHYYHLTENEEAAAVFEECKRRIRMSLEEHVPVKPGVVEMLSFFKEHHVKMAIASSSMKEQIIKNIQSAKLDAYFDEVVSGTEVQHGKPAPDIFLLAAQMLQIEPQNCYVFEDSFNGVLSGDAAGCETIMIPDLLQPSDEIAAHCKCVCRDFHEVITYLEQQSDN